MGVDCSSLVRSLGTVFLAIDQAWGRCVVGGTEGRAEVLNSLQEAGENVKGCGWGVLRIRERGLYGEGEN